MEPEFNKTARPDDGGDVLISTGLGLRDLEVVVCSAHLDGSGVDDGQFLASRDVWENDGDGDRAAVCTRHHAPHWIIDLPTALREGYASFSEAANTGDSVMHSLDSLLAYAVESLRKVATA